MEIAIIVNENDEVIDHKDRSTIQKEDIYRVSALLVRNSKWEFLLAQRGFSKSNNPWAWSFSVAWWVAEWETYDQNIIKETEEEIWVIGLKMRKIFKKRITGKHNFYCQFYMANMDVDIDHFTKEDKEVEELRWFSSDEIRRWEYRWYPFSKTLMQYLEDFETM